MRRSPRRPVGRPNVRVRSRAGRPSPPRSGRVLMADQRISLAERVVLALLAFTSAGIGVWAAFAPRAFYDKFPGLGQVWVAVDGPYNEHLVRDFGALNLAL